MRYILTALFLVWATISQAQGTIVLLVDTSSSMTTGQLDIQFDSYAKALRELPYLDNVNIEVVLFGDRPFLIASGNRFSAATAFDNINRNSYSYRGSTCLTKALWFVEMMLDKLPPPVVIDISGDGEANCHDVKELHPTLDRIASRGVRVNTLLVTNQAYNGILEDTSPVTEYQNMTRDGFMIHAKSYYDFELAIFEKLTVEIAQLQIND